MTKASVRKIGRASGYSPATVSNVLAGRTGVSEEAAGKVLSAARDLGYQGPRAFEEVVFVLARKTGLCLDEGSFRAAVINGVSKEATDLGLRTSYVTLELSKPDACADELSRISADPSKAIVLLGSEMEEGDYALFDDVTVPFIVVDGLSESRFLDAVCFSNERAAYQAVSYLISHGHRRIGYLTGSFRTRNFDLRERGYRHALSDAGLSVDERYHVSLGTTLDTSYADMHEWLSHDPELPTAFFADNDFLAVGGMRALQEAGHDVPGEVSIIGFDDPTFSGFTNPPLTTIHMPKHEIGELAVRTLVDHARHPLGYNMVINVSTTLVERESVRTL
jgi:LacI family transcriptional regulator/LacI family purine nucleotide synthesis repressor